MVEIGYIKKRLTKTTKASQFKLCNNQSDKKNIIISTKIKENSQSIETDQGDKIMIQKMIYLEPWQEVTGFLTHVKIHDAMLILEFKQGLIVAVSFDGKLFYTIKKMINCWISILRTGLDDNPRYKVKYTGNRP